MSDWTNSHPREGDGKWVRARERAASMTLAEIVKRIDLGASDARAVSWQEHIAMLDRLPELLSDAVMLIDRLESRIDYLEEASR